MPKFILSIVLVFLNTVLLVGNVHAASPTAANIFATIGGTTTIDDGGAIHSQARSIYSLGGGMTSFKGKKVSLLAADPPGFSAGCSGISWHFGGFAFISMDEIRQLVEAVAQASLGVAVDLAMQTLCPQCYAVMSKLRDISNMMRNAAADSCKIAKNFGAMLQDKGVFSPDKSQTDCSTMKASDGETSSFLGAAADVCKMLSRAEDSLKTAGNDLKSWMEGGNATNKKVTKAQLDSYGNLTYKGLSALGYSDGFVMNLLLSFTGMTIVDPVPAADCKESFRLMFGSTSADSIPSAELERLLADTNEQIVKPATSGAAPTVADAAAKSNPAKLNPSDASVGKNVCHAPPLLKGLDELGYRIMCGFSPTQDMLRFATKYAAGNDPQVKLDNLSSTSLGRMCNTTALKNGAEKIVASEDQTNPWMYDCGSNSGGCINPGMKRMKTLLNDGSAGEYSGLAWMILDSLYAGVVAVKNNSPLPDNTKAILNGSGYPLYRLINMAAVYPGMADELLQAYGGAISTQYTMDTLEKVLRYGAQPFIDTKGRSGGMDYMQLSTLKAEISRMTTSASAIREDALKSLSQKRALVDNIIQVNKALQAEVISQGLGGNADLAVNIKRQSIK